MIPHLALAVNFQKSAESGPAPLPPTLLELCFTSAGEGSRVGSVSIQPKVNLYVDLYGDRTAVFHRRLKTPTLHGFNRLLIQTHT
jgi:hypothetical protein